MFFEDFIRSILSSGYPAKENQYFMNSTAIHALTKLDLQNQCDNSRKDEIIADWSPTKLRIWKILMLNLGPEGKCAQCFDAL
jgi:hypothetical protein